ncbi:hypothetical protein [Vibrio phage BONAISHI]|nr:hypothetical protein [Vibrio phage BONAISHI]
MKFYLRSNRKRMEGFLKHVRRSKTGASLRLIALAIRKWDRAKRFPKVWAKGSPEDFAWSFCKLTGDLKLWHRTADNCLVLYESFFAGLDYPYVQVMTIEHGTVKEVNPNEFEKFNCWYDYWHKDKTISERKQEESRLLGFLNRFGDQ